MAAELLDETARGGCGAARRDDVVHNEHLLARLYRVGLHLEEVLAVLLFVACRLGRAGQLALLPHGHEAGVEAQGQGGAEEEASGLEAYDDIRLLVCVCDVELEGADERLVSLGIGEDGEDVFEEDAGRWEVGELAERCFELGLEVCELAQRTGLFGGAAGVSVPDALFCALMAGYAGAGAGAGDGERGAMERWGTRSGDGRPCRPGPRRGSGGRAVQAQAQAPARVAMMQ